MTLTNTCPRARHHSLFEAWVLNRFGGTDPKQAISDHAEKLVHATGINAPPVCMVKLATRMGVNPWPVYEPGTEGAIKLVDGRIRIVLRRSQKGHQTSGAVLGRTRFTYAHELAHTLFYDLESRPPLRLAPTGFHRIEEQLCNKAASQFLIPGWLLRRELSPVDAFSIALFRKLADRFQTSIQAIAYRIAEQYSDKLEPSRFVMLSTNGTGIRGTGLEKPRCIVCILSPELSAQKFSFLQSYQGVNRVRLLDHYPDRPWSLDRYFETKLNRKPNELLHSNEVVKCPCGTILKLNVSHSAAGGGALVWSEGSMQIVELR